MQHCQAGSGARAEAGGPACRLPCSPRPLMPAAAMGRSLAAPKHGADPRQGTFSLATPGFRDDYFDIQEKEV